MPDSLVVTLKPTMKFCWGLTVGYVSTLVYWFSMLQPDLSVLPDLYKHGNCLRILLFIFALPTTVSHRTFYHAQICAMHLASQRGHVEVINLLLQWKADVTFRSADGRNALDYAIDFSQKDCVLALIKHETWQSSLKNTVVNPVTGKVMVCNFFWFISSKARVFVKIPWAFRVKALLSQRRNL